MVTKNRLNDYLPDINGDYDNIMKKINEMMSSGNIYEYVIASSAKLKIRNTKVLQDYQHSDEWRKFFWGHRLIRLDDKLYWIADLRHQKDNFDKHPFCLYEVIGSRKLRLKYKMDKFTDYNCCAKLTWMGLKKCELVKSNFNAYNKIYQKNGGLIKD